MKIMNHEFTGKRRYLFLISPAMAIKACSTLVAFFALVSINGMPRSSAKAYEQKIWMRFFYFSMVDENKQHRELNHYYLGCFIRNHFFSSKITLVSHQKLVHVPTCIAIDFIQPLLHIVEARLVGNIINYLPDVEQTL